MPVQQVDYDDELSKSLPDAVRRHDLEKVRALVDDPRVNINRIPPHPEHFQEPQTCLMWAAKREVPDAIWRTLLGSDRIDVNLKTDQGHCALQSVAMDGSASKMRECLEDDRFDVHVRSDIHGSILHFALDSSSSPRQYDRCLEIVRAILEDGRVQLEPDMFTKFHLPTSCLQLILQHAGRRVRDDFQNMRRASNKMGIPQEIVDLKLLPFLGQGIFPAGMEMDLLDPQLCDPRVWQRQLKNFQQIKKFVELFGSVGDFVWPQAQDAAGRLIARASRYFRPEEEDELGLSSGELVEILALEMLEDELDLDG